MNPAIFTACQPVFRYDMDALFSGSADDIGEVFGYKLTFRPAENKGFAHPADSTEGERATAAILGDGYAAACNVVDMTGRRAFITVGPDGLTDRAPRVLTPATCAIEVPPQVSGQMPGGRAVADALTEYAEAGYLVCLHGDGPHLFDDALLPAAGCLKLDASRFTSPQAVSEALGQLTAGLATTPLLYAHKVEDAAIFEAAIAGGVTLFSGTYFEAPHIIEGRTLPPAHVARMEALSQLAAPELDEDRITRILSADPALSFRLLRFINSPAFPTRYEIGSVRQAITYMGTTALRRWLMVVLLTDDDAPARVTEAIRVALHRARFLQLLTREAAAQSGTTAVEPLADSRFLVGLFSKLDTLFDAPLEDLLRQINLADDVRRALTSREGPHAPWLTLAESLHFGYWNRALDTLHGFCPLPLANVARLWNQAGEWAIGSLTVCLTACTEDTSSARE